ncbi:hypothetical protein DXG03_000113 [Asterophora parasitica]|uniref:Up-regulated during septation protein 1 domain-containing protein n=1 Tax=Asterophora parasitica TaxID=117018 RepID=A0A9P7KHG0_9AGAR|nr:hypothetical protein DXG03_000113 [Asterophora parasitica]
MNGVRRFLGTATASSSSPPPATIETQIPPFATVDSGPSWPPSSPTTAVPLTAALNFKKDLSRQRTRHIDGEPGRTSLDSPLRQSTDLPPSLAPSSSRVVPQRLALRKSVVKSQSISSDADWKRSSGASSSSGTSTTRDELLLSLLASQAVVDSRDFDILSSEQIDDLSKEHQLLTVRLEAMTKKVALETKIRDAAASLAKVNTTHKKSSKQTDEQLEAANKRVDAAQRDLWRVAERAHEVHRRLLEHRAGVLSYSVRSMEKKIGGNTNGTSEDSGYDSSNLMSPTTSSMTGFSSSSRKARFDGLHLFAGHADTIVPRRQLSPEAAAAEITLLEEKLKAATESLTAAGKKQVEMTRELSLLRLEKDEVETLMGMDLQNAEEKIKALEREVPRLEEMDLEVRELREEKVAWEEEKARLEEQGTHVDLLRTRLQEAESSRDGASAGSAQELAESRRLLQEKDEEIRQLTMQWHTEREVWKRQKAEAEDEKMDDLARLQQEMDAVREEDSRALQDAHSELDAGLDALGTLVKDHGIVLFSRDSSLQVILSSVSAHLDAVHKKLEAHTRAESEWDTVRRKLEEDVRTGLDKREALARDLELARHERDDTRNETRSVERSNVTLEVPNPASPIAPSSGSDDRTTQILRPLWNVLPSPEARAAKFSNSRQFRTGSPTSQQNGSSKPVASLSELDVRSLKSLYDSTKQPMSPVVGSGDFSLEAFATRVQALIQDDRALIERLVRFAQAHDLLKKNAERAQKLAQEGNTALETYQKQVRTLEERNMTMAAKQAALLEELQQLQSSLDRIESEKRDVEMLAAEQAETCRQLTEANNTLSARTLTLAEEAASAPEMVRKQLEGQLSETRAALEAAQDEVEGMRMSEQSQMKTLLDELNSMQKENEVLRSQLRARK